VDAARQSDAVVLFLGEEESLSGEAASRTRLDLPGAQEALVTEVAKAGKPIVAVILAGRPLTFHSVTAQANAVLYAWDPGFMGGPAISDVLFGVVSPSGRLPVTFPRHLGQVPIYYNHLNTGRPPAESGPQAENKYTSKYIDVSFTPEYPFGFGLSYTRFEYSNLRLSHPQARAGETLTIRADIANTGSFEADEVAQLYTHQVTASIVQPVRQLRAFRRVHMKPGEKQTVEFALKINDLAFHDAEGRLTLEPGAFEVWVAPDSASGVRGEFRVQH
jgi:beta-glucosidase